MNTIKIILLEWKATGLLGFNKSFTPKYLNVDKLIFHIYLTTETAFPNEVSEIVLSRCFVPLGNDKDSYRLIGFLQNINNEIFLASIGII